MTSRTGFLKRITTAISPRVTTLTALFAISLILITMIPATQASFPGINGPIVFTNCDTGDGSIWKINPDGSGLTRITPMGFPRVELPKVSPDGSMVAFGNEEGEVDPEDGAIYVVSTDGGTPTLVPDTVGITGADPAWTPNGKKLVFDCELDNHLCTLPVTGGTPSVISGSFGGDVPDVRPDGSEVAYVKLSGFSDIASIPIGGGIPIQRTNCAISSSVPCDFPSYAPDGGSIALQRGDSGSSCIAVMPADGESENPACLANSTGGNDENPSFSPDGKQIVADAGSGNLVIINADGSGLRTNIDVATISSGAVAHTCSPSWGVSPLSFDKKAPEALCGKIFFDAQRRAESKKAQLSVKFIKAGCDAEASTELEPDLAKFDAFIDKIAEKANEAIDKVGGPDACDVNLKDQFLPVDRTDLLDGSNSGSEFINSEVETFCNGVPDIS